MPSTAGLPGGSLPFSGPLDLASINAEWGLGTDLTKYHAAKWYYDGNLTFGYFSSGVNSIKISDFYGKRATDPANGGTYFSNAVGSGSFTTPLYRNSFTIEIWGGGGSGGGGDGGNGGNGGDSSMLGVIAGGGLGGKAGNIPVPPPPADTSTNTGHGGEYVPADTPTLDSSTSKPAAPNGTDFGGGTNPGITGPTTGTTGTAFA